MSVIIALILVALGIFLYWFGYEVGSGKHKAEPFDKFFPLFGRNIDYVLGTAGIPMAIGIFILAFGVWSELRFLNYIAAVFVLAGVSGFGLVQPFNSEIATAKRPKNARIM